MDKIVFTPIGCVRNMAGENTHAEDIRNMLSEIIIYPKYERGLMDIEVNELITVIFYFSKVENYRLRLHPRGDTSRPITGVFNTRSQFRPNPIGITVVRLKSREGNKLFVEGLDALDGTPVLDIKPHVLTFDEGLETDDPRKDRIIKVIER
ncbi:tRNA (N6-threonylcarbamoyladenosine(37)-N6)-methyltransferase TrmO [Methanocella sp. CWC-04]|uniref:tRNA (N6-threonylcarbamoyladenosine(37)-N6)-methyltransferase TrmO n=1 Tax=Methanooceanicella nereidis TaxID=2052831 RepID=A0AAP2RCK7_9EURY|nr:tRNA (N6-threonylcarbamoyladenosine(37)-N6)-methyltransferase TrmO [Methanocella sp. CWC-04]MCD1294848.1 tRNA (N6-threonylcarbamoyladenosine(37)-N6)-methyltransferase TrmO [Methanocella sp. CWC-04]